MREESKAEIKERRDEIHKELVELQRRVAVLKAEKNFLDVRLEQLEPANRSFV